MLFRSDSELVIKQMLGIYKVKHAAMQPLHAEARRLTAQLDRVTFEHVRREFNKVADGLSNQAMDLVEGKTPTTAAPTAPEPAPVEEAPLAPRTISIPRPARAAHSRPPATAPRFDFDID